MKRAQPKLVSGYAVTAIFMALALINLMTTERLDAQTLNVIFCQTFPIAIAAGTLTFLITNHQRRNK